MPTSEWKAGEPLEDRYGLLVPPEAAGGDYQVQLILYRLSDGESPRAQLANVVVAPKPTKDERR